MSVLRVRSESNELESLEVRACDSTTWVPPFSLSEVFHVAGVTGVELKAGVMQAHSVAADYPGHRTHRSRWVPLTSSSPPPHGFDPTLRVRYIFSPTVKREGRDAQRYGPAGERLVVGAIVVRPGPEVLLIASSNLEKGGEYVIPKGGWDNDESAEECVLREVWEESGVLGVVVGLLDVSTHTNGKKGAATTLHVYVVRSEEEKDAYPEASLRQRRWVPLSEAAQHVKKVELARCFALPNLSELIYRSKV